MDHNGKMKIRYVNFATTTCAYCGRPALFACDMPVAHHRWCGHPPRSEMERGNGQMSWQEACSKPLCGMCAISIGNDVHFCLGCAGQVVAARSKKCFESG